MGSSSGACASRLLLRRAPRRASLLVASLRLLVAFVVLPSAHDCRASSVAASAVAEPSPRWLGGVRARRALLQAADVASDEAGSVEPSLLLPAPHTIVTVDANGAGDYATVQGAIDGVPVGNTQRVVIRIFSGIYRFSEKWSSPFDHYHANFRSSKQLGVRWCECLRPYLAFFQREKVYIPSNKPFITFLGTGYSPPVITWNDTATSAGSTWKSSSVSIDAANFIAKGITFENAAPTPAPGAVGAQAIALRIGGDMAAFYGCTFLGAQDTLCDWMGRHYFQNCFIQGSIDFIFGNGQSLYEGCTISSIAQSSGSITAHYRQTSDDPSGYSFVNCDIIGEGYIVLGRAWGPYSRVVFSMTTMTNIIDPRGWSDWDNTTNDETVYYGEYNNFGEGANLTLRVPFSHALTQEEAQPFLSKAWIDGTDWLPF